MKIQYILGLSALSILIGQAGWAATATEYQLIQGGPQLHVPGGPTVPVPAAGPNIPTVPVTAPFVAPKVSIPIQTINPVVPVNVPEPSMPTGKK